MHIKAKSQSPPRLTYWIIMICGVLFVWNSFQLVDLKKEKSSAFFLDLTPLFLTLSYDYSKADQTYAQFFLTHEAATEKDFEVLARSQDVKKLEGEPRFEGVYEILLKWPKANKEFQLPLFEKIREGEVWRILSPCFMHGGLLHILFNMLWLLLLGKQIEERVKPWQYLSISFLIGVISNTAQYLTSGSFFLGYSGIIAGLAGFIWMRQKKAPWEGYPLERSTLIFLTVFVLGMAGIQITSFILLRFSIANFSINIANTAHIVGAITGIILGRIPFFSKGTI